MRKKRIISFFILLSFLVSSCTTVKSISGLNHSGKTVDELIQATPNVIADEIPHFDRLKEKIVSFKQRLKAGVILSDEDWRLHDELLQAYVALKSITVDNKIQIPPRSRKIVPIQTFCLDPHFAGPVKGERFVWKSANIEIPYLHDVVVYAIKRPEVYQSTIQSLIWNLKNGTHWENYPKNMQSILLSIDSQAFLKLPSDVKSKINTKITNLVTNKLKEWGLWQDVQNLTNWIKGEYRNFDNIQRQFLSLKSNFPLVQDNLLEQIPNTPLYVDTETNSYSNHVIRFYNPTDAPVVVDLDKYYMQSKRPDVQRMALKKIIPVELSSTNYPNQVVTESSAEEANELPADPQQASDELQDISSPPAPIVQDLENILYKDMLRLGIGFVPVVGDGADLYELLNGRNLVSGQELNWQGRLLSGLGLIVGSGEGYRYALRVINSPNQFIGEFEKGLSQVLGKRIVLNTQEFKQANAVLSQAGTEIKNLKKIIPEQESIIRPIISVSFKEETRIGYHATSTNAAKMIKENGFILSNKGRLGGQGVYVSNTQAGALAEYRYHNPSGPEPAVLKVEYNPGLEYKVTAKQDEFIGAVPVKADTLTTESVRLLGTYNSIIRNNSQKVVQ